MIPPPEVRVQLSEGDALDSAAPHTRGFECEIEAREFRVRGQPYLRPRLDASNLLRVDHLERIPKTLTALLLHLDDDKAAAAAQNEIELVASDACIRVEESVAAKSVVAESAPLAAIHAAS